MGLEIPEGPFLGVEGRPHTDVPGVPGGAQAPHLHEQPDRGLQQADKEGAEEADPIRHGGGAGEAPCDDVPALQQRDRHEKGPRMEDHR